MAMALGDEFDGNAINAYQLADSANDCQLARSMLAKRLKYLIKKLMGILDNEMSSVVCNEEERHYLKQYQWMVSKRCEHLFQHADDIVAISL